MSTRLVWTERGLDDLRKLDSQMRDRVLAAVERLGDTGQGDVKRLEGPEREAQKARYGGELFPADAAADHRGTRFLEFFQFDGRAGRPKGIIAIDLGSGHDHQ